GQLGAVTPQPVQPRTDRGEHRAQIPAAFPLDPQVLTPASAPGLNPVPAPVACPNHGHHAPTTPRAGPTQPRRGATRPGHRRTRHVARPSTPPSTRRGRA